MNRTFFKYLIVFALLVNFCFIYGQKITRLDSLINQWETNGIPLEHIKDYQEYTYYKKQHDVINESNNYVVDSLSKTNVENVCYNPGFELSDFSNWVRSEGVTTVQGVILPNTFYTPANSNSNGSSNIVTNASVFSNNFFVINTAVPSDSITGAGYDHESFNGTYHTFKARQTNGGNYSARINNAKADLIAKKIEYSFQVTANEPFLIYDYAYVFSDGGHLDGEQAAFSIKINDSIGNDISIGDLPYMVNVNNAISNPAFDQSFYKVLHSVFVYDVYYKKWATDTLNLCQYVGKKLKITFEAIDCIYGAHFCYAYVDAKCSSVYLPIQNISCRDSLNYGFAAPSGYINYQWIDTHGNILSPSQTGDQSFLSFTQYLQNCSTGNCTVNDNDIFTLQVTTNLGCVLTTTYSVKNYSVNTSVSSLINSCEGGNSGSISLNPSGGLNGNPYSYSWYNNTCTGNSIGSSNPLTGIPAGNYCVHVTNGNCVPKDTIITVNALPTIVKNNHQNLPTCLDSSYTIHSIGNGLNYTWYQNNIVLANQTSDSLQIDPTELYNTYTLVYSDMQGCKDSTQFYLNVTDNNTFNAISCPNDSITLFVSPTSSNPSQYQWYINGTEVTAINGGTNDSIWVNHNSNPPYVIYYVNNCKKIANNPIKLFPEQIFLPNQTTNVFTPNHDGVNDVFYPYEYNSLYSSKEIDLETNEYELNVYNRWGTLVHSSKLYSKGWDGKNLNSLPESDGTYFWIASYLSNCSSKSEKIIKKGFVQLFR